MKPPFGLGEPKEVDASPEVLVPMMLAGWSQCEPPRPFQAPTTEEVTKNVHD
jgi:hypothetical protein